MFTKPYPFRCLGKKKSAQTLFPHRIDYRFEARERSYIVTLQLAEFNVAAVKFCDIKDRKSRNAYDKVFNDGDAFRVITTCMYVMLDYWKKNPAVSFAFHAVPRVWENDLLKSKKIPKAKLTAFKRQYEKARFTIYNYAVLNKFSYDTFTPLRDEANNLYVLLNKKDPDPHHTIDTLGNYLLTNQNLIF